MSDVTLARLLIRLFSDGSLPYSCISMQNRGKLQRLIDAGVLEVNRIGAGRQIVLKDREALESYARSEYPSGLDQAMAASGVSISRGESVALLRDSKKTSRKVSEAILLRGFGNAALLSDRKQLPVAELTRIAGVAAIRLENTCKWGFSGKVAIVENQEIFFGFDTLRIDVDLIVYAGGRLSERIVGWLASPPMNTCTIIHCGDYDPVGMDEYRRLGQACPGRVSLYIPENIEWLFAKFGNPDLLHKNIAVLKRLRKEPDQIIQRIVRLMDSFGAGLEQEILLAVTNPTRKPGL